MRTASSDPSRLTITLGTSEITSAWPLSSSSVRAESSGTTVKATASSLGFSPQYLSLRTTVSFSPGCQLWSLKGPVPEAVLLKLAPSLVTWVGLRM